ncbi:phosphatase PAP2 family protein [Azohydromonas sp.]|uniref:phosphatase PAP2 family protein n=1 Tax=Azohydromonas sp. TaxID=1872666 RepID=UPI002C2D15CD|nr:phosphatase PAP2 family protein [Azohydromonas sp.]HMM86636.1 phosphatase PAP2 family protein [Azohydromonas sp.]
MSAVPASTPSGAAPHARRDAVVTLAALAAVVVWDLAGLDLPLSRAFADGGGFFARDAWWARTLLHDGGRWLSGVALAGMALHALWPHRGRHAPAARGYWLAVTVAALLLVPALKRASLTSCPWDLAEFGGHARHVPHWWFGVADGGPGHCFPSGHAVAAFAFFGAYFLWREHDPRVARKWLAAVLAAGLLFGAAQTARGAHFASHNLWSAWLCWTLCVLAARWQPRPAAAAQPAAGAPEPSQVV